MHRRYLFKAKRIDNGKWVEGFYFCMVHDDGRHVHHFIMPLGADLSLGTPIEKIQVEIDIETICQFTGLTDNNGKKIWEHDVVEIPAEDGYFVLKWVDTEARFVMESESLVVDFDNYWSHEVEVVGNIFDNPELLEGGVE